MNAASKSKGKNQRSIAPLLRLDHNSTQSLQAQLRTRIIGLIGAEILQPEMKMPSTRKLSAALGVSRNTVSLAYQHLIDDGHLFTRQRSGIYVAGRHIQKFSSAERVAGGASDSGESLAAGRMRRISGAGVRTRFAPDWHRYQYPFIEGYYDRSLFPVAEWREVSRMALGVNEVAEWSIDSAEADDEMLIDEIRTKLLPRRGIAARRDEILITVGEQQGLHLISELFSTANTKIVMEEPGLPDLRALFSLRGADVRPCPVDDDGLVTGPGLNGADIVHVSPSRQRPSGVTMTLKRRKALLAAAKAEDFLVIEDDFECEMNFLKDALPSLYSMDTSGRVIYLASISKVLAPGVRLGYLVAPREVIAQARHLRNLTTRRPSPNNQRAAAFFLSLGHYDTMLSRLTGVYEKRLIALRDALNHYRPLSIAIPGVSGGTAYWVKGPPGLDTEQLVKEAEAQGILIEPVSGYYVNPLAHTNMFRLGVTSIPAEKIRPGIEKLSRLIRELSAKTDGENPDKSTSFLKGDDIHEKIGGADLLYKTVYGEPCTISLSPDGIMTGRTGYANEDRDVGRWWLEGDLWCRQWSQWAYGEPAKFYIQVEGDRLFWLNADHDRVDQAIIVRP